MQEVGSSQVKANCLAQLERVRVTKRPLRVTRLGKPVGDGIPPSRRVSPAK